jgi:TPR repeat protein
VAAPPPAALVPAPKAAAPAMAAPVLAPPPPASTVATPDRDEVAALLGRARTYLSAGDVAAARLVLRRAAERDDPQAALALGGTYDPTVLKRLGIVNFQADPTLAREWYRRAAQLGSADATLRLEQLVQTADH